MIAELIKDENREVGEVQKAEFAKYQEKFISAISDGLNTPLVLALLWKTLDSVLNTATKLALIVEYDKVLGLDLSKITEDEIPEEIVVLAEARKVAKANRNWAESDSLRAQILELGYEILDAKEGYRLQKK